jgi:antitoxin ParD1/3/4
VASIDIDVVERQISRSRETRPVPNVSIGQTLESFIDDQVKLGRFQNASEVVRAGLRLLQERELEFAERSARLAQGINAAFEEPGADIPAKDAFARLERKYEADMKVRPRGA